jgi:hypothetical protein
MSSGNHLLPEDDVQYLTAKQLRYELRQNCGEIFILIHEYSLPSCYSPNRCTLLLKLLPGYPNTNPDMFWTTPGVRLTGGAVPAAAEVVEVYDGVQWQRWSRHAPQWRPGVDNLQTKLRSVRTELERGR